MRLPSSNPPGLWSDHDERATLTMYVGLAASILAAVVPIVVQAIGGALTTHIRAGRPDASATEVSGRVLGLGIYLTLLAVAGLVGWLLIIWAVKQMKSWARPVATAFFGVGAMLAIGNLAVADESAAVESTMLPVWVGVLGLLPCVAGAATMYVMWRP